HGKSSDMLNPIAPLIAHMSTFFTLNPGDVVLTGTPKGVGQLHKGDQLSLKFGKNLAFDTKAI
ncbi:fumarylacetoacetate hydrolase family protein, partial [Oleiphilus sp. HI0043]|uniref:fumarylacetoacetate hydrolase family protein n=6 Tax=Oleiphilus TaxID=141450 RepID=UPI000B1489FC